ncbi:carboxypeptidase-like regulatory domain-containing protein [Dyadobacter sp. 676]|uniref:Carboxypeptidase-like regulatory domain-containing protein n=1 Tax=Dyadobacter sp. 676 TaxID=3088362 RepID=A0AAU8FGE0_9BACT
MKSSIKSIAMTMVIAATVAFNSFADDKESKKAAAFGTGIFASKTGKIHVNVDKYTSDKAVVLITNKSGEAMYREIIDRNTGKFRKAFNVNELPAGTYTIEVSANGQKTEKQFEVAEIRTERQISIK